MTVPEAAAAPRRSGRSWSWKWLALPAIAYVAVIYLVPLVVLLLRSVTDGAQPFESYQRLFTTSGYVSTIGKTLGISAIAALACLLVGYPLAWTLAASGPRLRRVLLVAVVAPYLTSILVRTFSWQVLLGSVGPINWLLELVGIGKQDLIFTSGATIIGLVHYLLPLMVLPLMSVMTQVDPTLRRAARSMGAGRAESFVRVVWPATLPGVETGVILTFVYAVGAFVTPAIIGGQSGTMIGVLIHSSVSTRADYGLAAAASVLLAIAVITVVAFYRFRMAGNLEWLVSPEQAKQSAGSASRGRSTWGATVSALAAWLARALDRSGISRHAWLLTVYSFGVGAFLLVPQLVTAIPVSLSGTRTLIVPPPSYSTQWYANLLDPGWFQPLTTSLYIGIATAVLATGLAGLAAIAVVRALTGRAGALTTLLMLLPLIFPRVVSAAAYYNSYLRIGLIDTGLGIVLAHTAMTIPFAFAIVTAATRSLSPQYERAAASMGAPRLVQLRRITLPLLKPAFLTAAFFTFLLSFDEAVVAVFLSGLDVKTLPRRMFEALTLESDPTIGVIAVALMAVSAIVAVISGLSRGARKRRNGHEETA